MTPPRQQTLAAAIRLPGVGLHTGARVATTVHPAPDGHGIRVRRSDIAGTASVPWMEEYVQDTFLATSVGTAEWTVATAEHLVAALAGLAIDNALIEVDGPEVPVLDGSSAPWVAEIRSVGRTEGSAPRRVVAPRSAVEVCRGPAWARLEPAPALELDVSISFAHPHIGDQRLAIRPTPDRFEAELSWARTFGFLADVERMREAGRARGGSLTNAVVFGPDGPLNPEGLRSADEPVRHKTVDMMGDLALIGASLQARVRAHRPGHALTRALVAAARPHLDAVRPPA